MDCSFVWGVASAAYQIEGGYREDGKGDSIWDVMTHEPGKTQKGDTGDIACDHYHRYEEDVDWMAKLGVGGYRFSVSWSRVLPDGIGMPNEKGLAFYDRLIDALLAHGIEPYLTLYHWDLPQKLFERGGWLNPDAPDWFAQYAELIGKRFGDRVKYYITLNEPSNVLEGMKAGGGNAPGLAYSRHDRLTAIHHLLLAHGKAVQTLRRVVPEAKIGFAPCSTVICPADTEAETVELARKRYFSLKKDDLCGNVTLFSDPIFLGQYPPEYFEYYADILPEIREGDMELISTPVDFCFQNIYSGETIGQNGKRIKKHVPTNMLGWPICPEAMYWGPKFLYERYKKPIYITENGLPNADVISLDGKVHDPQRVDFIARYTRELLRAGDDGVDIRGYFYWSVTDNLEWELGYGPRFGLIFVDFDTQERIPKDSFFYYRDMIAGENDESKNSVL